MYSPQEALDGVIRLISDDRLAVTHQSLRGYRQMLLQGIADYQCRMDPRHRTAPSRHPFGPPDTSTVALFLGGPKNGQEIDLRDLHPTFMDWESNPESMAMVRVVYQLHRYPGPNGKAFYVDNRIGNPVALIKQHL
ncbi:hypothetical protein JET76_23135 [Pseudomonas putida]|uniref:hypothetical protein n=1 Tax=Pseudomonas putida TaxID=303 RepID=UPI0018E6A5A7|nr:hypothetical protein [Pseudomonas putida]MBI6944224.1 hypothetical protein [Pseudomonas putida]MBI6960325.1 hypothetical protein [Pseudomonas putida]